MNNEAFIISAGVIIVEITMIFVFGFQGIQTLASLLKKVLKENGVINKHNGNTKNKICINNRRIINIYIIHIHLPPIFSIYIFKNFIQIDNCSILWYTLYIK